MAARSPGESDRPHRDAVDVATRVRPGVPRVRPVSADPGAHGRAPGRQREGAPPPGPAAARHVAVFGTAQPLHGLSGLVRRAAYRLPERGTGRWLLLLAGDRADVLEHRLAHAAWMLPAALGLAIGYAAVSRALARR